VPRCPTGAFLWRFRIERLGRNPFTGKPMTLKTRDPGPDVTVAVPASLPFEHVHLPNEEDWETRYIALDMALAGEDGRAPDHYRDFDAQLATMIARGLYEEALFGGDASDDPRWVFVVPERLVIRLAALEEHALGDILETWNARSPSASTLDDLRDLWSLAWRAGAQQREMFLWLDAPPHRCSVHRPHRGRA
jgi:hypothetical protein